MHILLELSWFLIQGGQKEEVAKWLWEIIVYVDGNFDDYEAKVKVYPRAVKLLYPIYFLLLQLDKKHSCNSENLHKKYEKAQGIIL